MNVGYGTSLLTLIVAALSLVGTLRVSARLEAVEADLRAVLRRMNGGER